MRWNKKVLLLAGMTVLVFLFSLVTMVLENEAEIEKSKKTFTLEITDESGDTQIYTLETYQKYFIPYLENEEIIEEYDEDSQQGLILTGYSPKEPGSWVLTVNGKETTDDLWDVVLKDGSVYALTWQKE